MPTARTRTSARTSRAKIKKAEIGRFDGDLKVVAFKTGDTVQDIAKKAGFNLSQGEEVNDERGNTVNVDDKAKEQTYFLTSSYSNGI